MLQQQQLDEQRCCCWAGWWAGGSPTLLARQRHCGLLDNGGARDEDSLLVRVYACESRAPGQVVACSPVGGDGRLVLIRPKFEDLRGLDLL